MSEPPTKDAKGIEDVVLLFGRSEQGHLRGLRKRGEELALAELRPVREGQPLNDNELVSLRAREGSPALWDVEVHYCGEGVEARSAKGPVRVSSAAYRRGWEAIFGNRDDGALN